MKRLFQVLYPWLGVGVLGMLVFYHASRYGSHWRFSNRFTPEPIIAADGKHHPDGSPVNPIDLYLLKSGQLEAMWHVFYAICLSMGGLIFCCYRLCASVRIRKSRLDQLIDEMETAKPTSSGRSRWMLSRK